VFDEDRDVMLLMLDQGTNTTGLLDESTDRFVHSPLTIVAARRTVTHLRTFGEQEDHGV